MKGLAQPTGTESITSSLLVDSARFRSLLADRPSFGSLQMERVHVVNWELPTTFWIGLAVLVGLVSYVLWRKR